MAGRGSNSAQLRHYNERVVLEAVRRVGEASKAEIARFAHLTPPAVAGIVDAMVAGGYLVENGKRFGGKGQPSAMYGLAPGGAYSIGLHIGRRAMDAILTDFSDRQWRMRRTNMIIPNRRARANWVMRRSSASRLNLEGKGRGVLSGSVSLHHILSADGMRNSAFPPTSRWSGGHSI